MKITTHGHSRDHGPQTLVEQRGPGKVHWDTERRRLIVHFVCDQDAVREGSRHDLYVEVSMRELAALVGWAAVKLRQADALDALDPVLDVIRMIILGGPSNKPDLLWRWRADVSDE